MTREEALALLGLPSGATDTDVRERFRELAKEFHPDRGGSQKALAQLVEARAVCSERQAEARSFRSHRSPISFVLLLGRSPSGKSDESYESRAESWLTRYFALERIRCESCAVASPSGRRLLVYLPASHKSYGRRPCPRSLRTEPLLELHSLPPLSAFGSGCSTRGSAK
jgi:curved DNA-binding protein CbpA